MAASRISPELIERSFGLMAFVENRRVVLPLKAVECEFSVAAGVVEVRMTQVFRQENPKPLDCDYLFPLPADASVYFCEADINGRLIRAKVKERGEAVRLAAEKKAEGRRVALVEAERENLFTLSLKNLQPEDLVLVTLKYIQPLRHLADMPSVEIPFCPGVRYIPGNPLIRSNRGKGIHDDTNQTPDASRISPVRMDREHPDVSFIEVHGRLDGQYVDVSSVTSPSHNIVSRSESDQVMVRLSDTGEVPNRDFVLRWKETKAEQLSARAWIQEAGAEHYALMEIRAPKATGAPLPMDFYFLVDISGSMAGVKWQKAARAVQTCVAGLAENDRVMLTLFSNSPMDFAERPLSPAHLLADDHFKQLDQLVANGGTELGWALQYVLALAELHSQARKKAMVLITDAQVGNETGILKIVEKAGDFPIHCFGLDIALNDALLLALARKQGGTFHSLNPADDVVKVISDLAQAIRHPVLHDLSLSAGWEPAGKFIPPLYSGQIFHLSARSGGNQPLELAARNGSKDVIHVPIIRQPDSTEAPGLHWCKSRIQMLMDEGNVSAATALSVKSNLICPLTAFIAWDEFEKVAIASHMIAQPNLENPFGFSVHDRTAIGSQASSSPPRMAAGARNFARAAAMDAGTLLMSEMSSVGTTNQQMDGKGPLLRACERVIADIAEGATSIGTQPAPSRDRQGVKMVFEVFYTGTFGGKPPRELSELWKAIMQWAFADETKWESRSSATANLLRGLQNLAELKRFALLELYTHLQDLARKQNKPLYLAPRIVQAITTQHAWTADEVNRLIAAEFKTGVDAKVVAEFVRTSQGMKEAIEAFAKKYYLLALK